jgi:arginine metabolism regulation protein II
MQVVSAQLEDTYLYLREINRLIAIYGTEVSRISTTLRTLQNIFYYIRTMQDTLGVFSSEKLIHSPSLSTRPGICFHSIETSSSIPEACSCNDGSNSQSLFERVFSIPPSLFGLISRVTAFIHETEGVDINEATHTNSSLLSDRVNQLETEIWDWSSTSNNGVSPSPTTCLHGLAFSSPDTANHATDSPLHHYIEAMHSAVLIYFYRCVRKVDPLMIQHLVDKTIDSLARCTELRQKTHDPSSDICWPLFIAGCEALIPSTRKRVQDLFAIEAARTGIRMFEKACQATVEVWCVRDRRRNRHLSWSAILRESNMLDGLMIS